jgi:hypothetical protein
MVRIILGTASFLLMWTLCGPASAQAKTPRAPKGAWEKPIVGVGETEATAKKDALRKAANVIEGVMRQVDPPLRFFKIDDEFVQKHLLANTSKPGDDIKLEVLAEPAKQWIVTLRPYADWWQELLKREHSEEVKVRTEERKVHAEVRQSVTAKVMLGLSLLLLAGVGYVRLDEYTQRRYTAWLRLAGVGVATTLAAGVWWVFIQAPG